MKTTKLWKPISFSDNWKICDTSLLDDILPSWLKRREILQKKSKEYEEFLERLKRQHAIETGIIEGMYDIDRGITETLVQEGFISSYVSHGDINIPKKTLFAHLQDHLDAVNFVFDIIKEDRPLTKNFICALHQLTTRHQEFTEGRDQFGHKTKIHLIKGKFKNTENNPSREDGTMVLYCPPEHVEAEMDNLINIYNKICEDKINPLIIATWMHHAFTTIHPFQDGNGRVVRLIASLILIKNKLFPITVLREEAKLKYIQALEDADKDNPQKLVTYFAEIQKRHIEKALNIAEVSSTSLEEVTYLFKQKIINKQKEKQQYEEIFTKNRTQIFEYCYKFLNEHKNKLESEFADSGISFNLESSNFHDKDKQHYFYKQIVNYAKKYNYYFNRALPKAYFRFKIKFETKEYQLFITLHHYGYDNTVIAIGSFLAVIDKNTDDSNDFKIDNFMPLNVKPHIISIQDEVLLKEKNILLYLENVLTIGIAQIVNEI